MKLSVLAVAAVALAAMMQGPAVAQTATPPVTMQPIANPPEKPMKAHHHKAKPHDAVADKPASDAAPSAK